MRPRLYIVGGGRPTDERHAPRAHDAAWIMDTVCCTLAAIAVFAVLYLVALFGLSLGR